MTIVSLSQIALLVSVICPNQFGLHGQSAYIRYLVLVDTAGHGTWMDDPTEEDVERIFAHCLNAKHQIVYQHCQWCKSQQVLPD